MALSSTQPPPFFDLGSFALAAKFPALRFDSQAAFLAFLATDQDRLDGRYEYEQSLAVKAPTLVRSGTCAPCLRPAVFTSDLADGQVRADGAVVPNWRERMQCDCPDQLNNRQRALLHFVQASGVLPWSRLLLFGSAAAVDARLAAMVSQAVRVPPALGNRARAGFHLAISHDYLQHVPDLEGALGALRNRLAEGARFIFTVPFHHTEAASLRMDLRDYSGAVPAELRDRSHRLGWDLLDRLRDAGFRDAAAYLYWSEEFGYLGPMNFIFRAVC